MPGRLGKQGPAEVSYYWNAPGSIGTGKAYRGDTIHTFHTIFGRPNSEAPGHFFGIDRFAPIDDRLYERIRAFHRQSRTLGNYMVLPNIGLPVGRRTLTLNTWRGTNRWHDYVDQFLLALELCLEKGDRSDEILHRLVHERNALAFAEYMRPGGFAALANRLLLEDYLDADGHAANLFADVNGMLRFHWEKPQPPRELYLHGVTNYLDHAQRIIDRRSRRMIKKLSIFC